MPNELNNLYQFGEYAINAKERNLWRGEELIPLPPKVFATLLALVSAEGRVVTKDELLASIWSDSFVEESNLSQNIYTLRQIFGKENKFIETIPRKGYRFAVPVTRLSTAKVETENDAEIDPAPSEERRLSNSFSRRSKYLALSPLVGAILILIGFFVFNEFGKDRSPAETTEKLELKSITDSGTASSPAISPDGKFIAYIDRNDRARPIHLMDVQAGRTLTVPLTGKVAPGMLAFSPDGRDIYFRQRGLWRNARNIYRISYFGGEPELVAEDTWGQFSISPDGNRLAFFREDTATNVDQLILKDLQTSVETKALELVPPEQFFLLVAAAWSPDGKRLAYILRNSQGLRSDINVLTLDNGTVEKISTDLQKIFQIVWRPDGESILALAKEPEKGRQIWKVEYPAGKTSRVTNDLNSYLEISLSKDGKTFVSELQSLTSNVWVYPISEPAAGKALTTGSYGQYALGDLNFATLDRIIYDGRNEIERDLWSVNIGEGKQTRLTNDNGSRNGQVAATSDGQYLYISSNRDDTESIWRIAQDGSDPVQITRANGEVHWYPALSFDDLYLYYLARKKGSSEIRRIFLEDNTTETIYTIRDFSPLHFFRTSSDGKYLAFVYKSNNDAQPEENESKDMTVKIGLLDLESREIKTFGIQATRALIRFSNGGRSIDYIRGGDIMRQDLADLAAEPKIVFSIPNERIFNFDWSFTETHLAVARGGSRSDIVMFKLP